MLGFFEQLDTSLHRCRQKLGLAKQPWSRKFDAYSKNRGLLPSCLPHGKLGGALQECEDRPHEEDDISALARLAVHRYPELEVLCLVLDSNGSGSLAALFVVADEGEIVQEPPPRGDDVACIVVTDKVRTLRLIEIVEEENNLIEAIEELLILVETGCLWRHVSFVGKRTEKQLIVDWAQREGGG